MLDLRYRFRVDSAWNWWLAGGIGAVSIVPHDATKQERDDSTRPAGMLGIGLERRFTPSELGSNFAIQLELRGIGMGDSQRDKAQPTPVGMVTGTTQPTSSATNEKRSGGMVTIGAAYYF